MKGWTERGCPPFVAGATPLIIARQRQGACKWTLEGSADGRRTGDVAMEYDSELAVHRLADEGTPVACETLDVPMALWCCRVWQRSVAELRPHTAPTLLSSSAPWKRFW